MEMQIGQLAATRQTWREKTVRELFAELKQEHTRASEQALRKYFREAVRADDDYFLAVVDYAFDAAFRAFRLSEERQQSYIPATAAERAERAKNVAKEAEQHAKAVEYVKERIILLNQEMPNGKRARFCTLDYFYRLGGAYRSLGKKGSQKLVGSAYSEDQFRAKLRGLVND